MHDYIRRLYEDVMTNGAKGVQPSSVTLNGHQYNVPSHSIMVSYGSSTMSPYLPSGHNALES
jgi:hypothetical protein